MTIRDDYQVPMRDAPEPGSLVGSILATLTEALKRCQEQSNAWKRRDLGRAMVLIGGLDEKMVQEILDQKGI